MDSRHNTRLGLNSKLQVPLSIVLSTSEGQSYCLLAKVNSLLAKVNRRSIVLSTSEAEGQSYCLLAKVNSLLAKVNSLLAMVNSLLVMVNSLLAKVNRTVHMH